MTIHFKLTKLDGLTRRITFPTRPTWSLLSARIATLYDIPVQNLGVSYRDSDNDEVMLSSEEELNDFYTSAPVADGDVLRLAVYDLNVTRRPTLHTTSPHHHPHSHFRNTFGGNESFHAFEVEGDWERLPGLQESLYISRDAPESPHAFVEELESDASILRDREETGSADASRSELTFTRPIPRRSDKGKCRAATVRDDISSAGSVIGNEVPAKPPVHVYDVSDSEDVFGYSPSSSAPGLPQNGTATPAQAQSTPLITEQTLKSSLPTSTEERGLTVDDPPLPTLDLPDLTHPGPSLTHDVAAFLTTISTVISSHPELSEGLRNIVFNATNGTYWATHRDALSRAAENMQRTAVNETGRTLEELRRIAEEEAGTRVAEALGRIFRSISEFVPDHERNAAPAVAASTPPVLPNEVPYSGLAPSDRAPPRFPHPPLHPRRHHPSWFGQPHFARLEASFRGGLPHPPPPPPPPPPSIGSWPRPPPPVFWGLNTESASLVNDGVARSASRSDARNNVEAGNFEDTQGSKIANVQSSFTTSEATPEQLRAEVEKAKAEYKARKERYRQAKAARKISGHSNREQESSTESPGISRQPSDIPTQLASDSNPSSSNNSNSLPISESRTPAPAATPEFHIVSNARGPYPRLEMFSVPKRSHTTGHMHHMHRGPGHEVNRPLNRIMKKLADMGFTESAYSNLAGKVMNQLLSHPDVTKDGEDDIVTNMIEELLVPTDSAPHASGSGIPGAWH